MLTTIESLKVVQGILSLERQKPAGTRSARIAMEAEVTADVLIARLALNREKAHGASK